MNITHKFNFTDHRDIPLAGEVHRTMDGLYVPDSVRGMGKDYRDPAAGVADYIRRLGGKLKGSLITVRAESRPTIVLTRSVRITLPWQLPSVDLPAGTEGYVRPANNLPGRDQYWLEHDAIEHDYGVCLTGDDFAYGSLES